VLFADKLIIIGASRSGKTTIGKELSLSLALPFFDSDKELLKKHALDKTVAGLYQKWGEIEFRKKENSLVKNLLKKKKGIFSLGGGVSLQKELHQEIKLAGPVLFLDVERKELLRRYLINTPYFMNELSDDERAVCIEKRRLGCLLMADISLSIPVGKSVEDIVKEVMQMRLKVSYGIK